MAGYELHITATAAKELDALPRKKDRQAVVSRILALAEVPRPPGCVKLSGVEDLYRVRQGRYRIAYTIEDDRLMVVVVRIAGGLPRRSPNQLTAADASLQAAPLSSRASERDQRREQDRPRGSRRKLVAGSIAEVKRRYGQHAAA